MRLNVSASDAFSLLTLLVGMFGGKKRKRLATELLPDVMSAIDQWENGGVREALVVVSSANPVLERFRATLDRIYTAAKAQR